MITSINLKIKSRQFKSSYHVILCSFHILWKFSFHFNLIDIPEKKKRKKNNEQKNLKIITIIQKHKIHKIVKVQSTFRNHESLYNNVIIK